MTTDGPTPEQAAQIMASSDPISTMLPMMPDEMLTAVAKGVVAECERRGLEIEL